MRVVLGMSGGVDSAVAARLLQEQGHEVVGVFLAMGAPAGEGSGSYAAAGDSAAARHAADVMGVDLHERHAARTFFDRVVMDAVDAYAAGLTPNPCVVCNEQMKLAALERAAHEIGADLVATGHYARVGFSETGKACLLRGRDDAKDQSYFLHRLSAERLASIRFPLGEMSKHEVRGRAEALGLAVAHGDESQELCFVPEGASYADLVERFRPERVCPGYIVDARGQELGRHDGVHRFTVGQRRGLGVAQGRRMYVTGIDPATGTVVVGGAGELERRDIAVGSTSWVAGEPPAERFRTTVRVRARHPGVEATATVVGDRLLLTTDEPVRAAAPGQAAVFYRGDLVLGGGWILRESP